jgi:hypothetical protein
MKLLLAFILSVSALAFAGCSTTQQTTTYQALSTIETTADTAYSAYVGQVVKGTVSTYALPQLSKAYYDLHAAIATAAILDQAGGTNAFVSSNLTAELTSFVQLITTVTANH